MWMVGWVEELEEVQTDLKAMMEEMVETMSMRPPISISIKYMSCRRQGLCLGKWAKPMKSGKDIYGGTSLKTREQPETGYKKL